MEINLDTGKLFVFLGGLVLFLLVETLFPTREWQDSRMKRIAFHGGIAVLNTIIIRILIYVPFLLWVVYVEEEGWGISRWLEIYGWTETILSIVVLDFFDYIWHRANHRVRDPKVVAHRIDDRVDVIGIGGDDRDRHRQSIFLRLRQIGRGGGGGGLAQITPALRAASITPWASSTGRSS